MDARSNIEISLRDTEIDQISKLEKRPGELPEKGKMYLNLLLD